VLLLDALVGNGGKAQSRFESSGDGGLARDGMVMPREGARNGDRPDDVLIGDMALEPRPLLAGVSSFGCTSGRPVDCQFPSGRDRISCVPIAFVCNRGGGGALATLEAKGRSSAVSGDDFDGTCAVLN
jgi:hypothetical protein